MLIQKWRLQRGWSQEQLATLSGLSVRTIQRIENGHKPSAESLKSLASVFDTDFTRLSQEIAMSASTATAAPTISTISSPQPSSQSPLSGGNGGGASTNPAITPDEEAALRYVRELRRFYRHVIRYVVVISVLAVVNVLHRPEHLWVLWVAGFWGLGLLMHAGRTFAWGHLFGPAWERRQVERYLGRKL